MSRSVTLFVTLSWITYVGVEVAPEKDGITVFRHAEFDSDTTRRYIVQEHPLCLERSGRPAGRSAGHTFHESILIGNLRLQQYRNRLDSFVTADMF